MRPVHVIVLLMAGALGGAVIMKVVRPVRPAIPVADVVPAQPPVAPPEPTAPAVAAEPSPAPMAVDEPAKPSPMPPPVTRVISKPQRPHLVLPVVAAVTPAPAPPPPPPAPSIPTVAPPPVNAEPPQVSAPVPEPHQVTLNAGVILPVRLVDGLSSERNVPGDLFSATLDKELVVDGWVIAERGGRVEGRIVAVDRARAGRSAAMALELTTLHTSDGQSVPIRTESYFKHADPPQIDNTTRIAGGAILGAAIGAGIGGGAGAGDVLLTRHRAELPSETAVTFRLKNPVPLTEQVR